jgi:hypothetical protein
MDHSQPTTITKAASVLLFALALSPQLARPSEITADAYVEQTIEQTGRYQIDVSITRKSSHGWRWRDPDKGGGYNWSNWYMNFGDLDIPEGSTINSATLEWNRTLWDPTWHWDNRPQDFYCKSGGGCVGSTVDSVDLDTWSNLVFVESGGRQHWFSVPEPRDPTGTLDLMALGFGPDIAASRSVTLAGALQLSLGRVYLNEGWNAHNEFDWQGRTKMGMAGTLRVDFTAPAEPSPEVPEPLTMGLTGIGLVSFPLIRRFRRT